MTLRERCDELYSKLQGTRSIYWPCPIEDFAREIRNEAREETLAIFYRAHPQHVARICDEVWDPSGAMLGRVRKLADALAASVKTEGVDNG